VPDGVNTIFKPSIVFNDITGYSMTIFNRWGEQIFVSNEYGTGWDGTMNGKDSPAGGYAYLIRFNGLDGFLNEYKGIVLLIR
jgi:gliding motility-associated-like protein